MALNLKSPEVDTLAAEVAALAHESKTEAVRQALIERKDRLTAAMVGRTRSERVASLLADFRASLPEAVRGTPLTREQEDEILGFGPDGV